MKNKRIFSILFTLIISWLILPQTTRAADEWRVLAIRSESEFNQGMIGGEGMQLPLGITRCDSNPNYIYWAHDNSGPWKSADGGVTWKRCLSKGIYSSGANDAIQVDPVNPDIVFTVSTHLWYAQDSEFDGLYRSTDGGDNWELVLPTSCGFDWNKHRYIKSTIAYDPATKEATKTRIWYAVFHYNDVAPVSGGFLYKSTDYGSSWTQLTSTTIDKFYQIAVGEDNRVYLGTDDGLFLYTPETGTLNALGDLPAGAVTSIFVHPTARSVVFVTVLGNGANIGGLFKSTDSGAHFTELKHNKNTWAAFYNNGHPDTIYLGSNSYTQGYKAAVTHNGGTTWTELPNCNDVPVSQYPKSPYGIESGFVSSATNPNDAVVFSNANIYKTTDGGKTINESATLFTGYSVVLPSSFAFDQFDPNRFALGLADVGYVVTKNGGKWFYKNWNKSGGGYVSDWGKDPTHYLTNPGSIYCPSIDFKPIKGSEAMAATVGYSPISGAKTRRMYLANEATGWALEANFNQVVTPPSIAYTDWDLFLQYDRTDPNIVFTSVSKSTNGGISYQPVNFSPYTAYYANIMGSCLTHPDVYYATYQYDQQILRSADKGVTWISIASPGWKFNWQSPLPTFAVDPIDPEMIYSIDSTGDVARCKKTNGVWRWTSLGLLAQIPKPTTLYCFVRQIAIDPRHNNVIYAVVTGAGISNLWRSIDSGATWQDISYNLARTGNYFIGVSPLSGELLAGGLTGTYVLPPPYASETAIYDNCAVLPTASVIYGDVSGDGQVTAYDSALTSQAVVGSVILTVDQKKAADVSGDGQVTAYDAALIAQKAVGLITKFPVEN